MLVQSLSAVKKNQIIGDKRYRKVGILTYQLVKIIMFLEKTPWKNSTKTYNALPP